MAQLSHISVIIPVFNEEQSLPKVINALPRKMIDEIIVVNNGSTDQSSQVARKLGCRVVNEHQRGYGKACLTGIAALNHDTTVVAFIDGDYSDHPQELTKLVRPILDFEADLVLGSRILGKREKGAMMPQAYYGNKLACFLMNKFWGYQYTDLGPFRVIRRDALEKLGMADENFGWTIEMQIKAVEKKLRIKELPVRYRKRVGRSKISGTFLGTILAGEKILRTIFKYKFFR